MEAEPAAALAPVLRSWYHPMSAAPSLLHLTLLEGGKGDFLTLTETAYITKEFLLLQYSTVFLYGCYM